MEEVLGSTDSLPPLAEFPPPIVRAHLLPDEWQACLDAWIFAVEYRLRLSPEKFTILKFSDTASGFPFLLSYFQNRSHEFDRTAANASHQFRESKLHRQCFLLTRRLLLETNLPYDTSPTDLFEILSHGSSAFGSSAIWKETLQKVLEKTEHEFSAAIEANKSRVIQESLRPQSAHGVPISSLLLQITSFIKVFPPAGVLFMTGSDYLDSLVSCYQTSQAHQLSENSELEQTLTANLYFCLMSLINVDLPRSSLLLDHLYSLKATTGQHASSESFQATILSSLLCSTTFLRHLDGFLITHEQKRGERLLSELYLYRESTLHLHPMPTRKAVRLDKGKGKTLPDGGMEIHKASQVSQIHDLFPELTSSYILRLLDHFSHDIEAVTAALLEPESLPSDLKENASTEANTDTRSQKKSFDGLQATSLLPVRKNVFDDDDFDNLRVSASKLHIGRKDIASDVPTNSNDQAKQKAAILAALATFDSDDDERDDTYDVADVGGTVDDTLDTDSRPKAKSSSGQVHDLHEERLFGAWKNTPSIFARDSKTRISQPRQELKRETGMSDEQIEGWAIMLQRDKALLTKMEKKYSQAFAFGGNQHALAGARWRAEPGTEEEEDSEADRTSHTAGQSRGGRESYRGKAKGGSGRGGGKTSGPSSDPATQAARRRKEQGRGRGGANHNRREGRAKKIGRGMAGGPG